jgi:hypothetical protein
VTGADGSYTVPNVPAGMYAVTASRTGYTPTTLNPIIVGAGQTATVNVSLVSLLGSVSGRVTDPAGLAVAGATVTTTPATSTATTDAQGTYRISGMTPGSYTVTASKSGVGAATTTISVIAGSASTVNLALRRVYDGTWRGTTGGGDSISFTITNNALVFLRTKIMVSLCGTTAFLDQTFSIPLPIVGDSLPKLSVDPVPPLGVGRIFSGRFTSDTRASGVVTVEVKLFPPLGTCDAARASVWSATKG